MMILDNYKILDSTIRREGVKWLLPTPNFLALSNIFFLRRKDTINLRNKDA
jgi:hypothetical protein